jgi:hypothetical protein
MVFEDHGAFIARGSKYLIQVQSDGATVHLSNRGHATAVAMRIVGADSKAQPLGKQPLTSYSNYYIGNDPSKWREHVPHYGRVRVPEVRPGIGIEYYGTGSQLEYDVDVAPGARIKDMRIRFEGAESIGLNDSGDLLLHTQAGDLTQHRPIAWQDIGGTKHPVDVRYRLRAKSEVALRVGKFDSRYALTIDPVLSYSTYLSGSSIDAPAAIAVDSSGAYIAGSTQSTNFPVTFGSYQGDTDAFVTKLNASGTALVYSTYLGGSGTDAANGIAIDNLGDAYVVGYTNSSNFPIVSSASTVNQQDAFVTKFGPGGAIVYSLVLGSNSTAATAIAVDSSYYAYVTGTSYATNFPTTTGSLSASKSSYSQTGFVAKLDPSSNIVYATYLGGSYSDQPTAIQVDANGYAYIAGSTSSSDFPITGGAFQTSLKTGPDGFISKLNPAGSALVYSTFLGGSANDSCAGLQIDGYGNAYVLGTTNSADFPATPGAFSSRYTGSYYSQAFVAKLNSSGSALVYATYVGGSGGDTGTGLVIDSLGDVYGTGWTNSVNFPTTPGSLKTTREAANYSADADLFFIRTESVRRRAGLFDLFRWLGE